MRDVRGDPARRSDTTSGRTRGPGTRGEEASRGRTSGASASELPEDFAAWFRDHRRVVYRYVRFRVSTRAVAEDVTSDVFFKALRALDRYDAGRASPRTWLLRIARNAVTDHFRALKRRGSLHVSLDRVPDLVADAASPEERIMKEERIETLLNGARSLGENDREVLSLRYGAGLSNGEIAEMLDITVNAVAVRVHRALNRLRDAVRSDEDG